MASVFVGVDCGMTGAIAAILPDGSVRFWDMPTFSVERRKGTKTGHRTQFDVPGLASVFGEVSSLAGDGGLLATIESAQAMPAQLHGRTQGTASSFAVGLGYGIVLGVVGAMRLRHELVRPATWKPKLMAGLPKEKDAARMRACQLFPQASDDLRRKKDHGRAEALLLAEWGRRLYAPTGAY